MRHTEAKLRIGITHAEGDEHLLMRVATGSQCGVHLLSLVQARALSLEIIKQVYRAELRSGLNKSKSSQPVA